MNKINQLMTFLLSNINNNGSGNNGVGSSGAKWM